MENAVCQPAVVGEQEEAFGVAVEPPDVAKPGQIGGKQIVDGARPPCGSDRVVRTPAGLWYAIQRGRSGCTRRPSNSTTSRSGSTLIPKVVT